MPTELCLIPTSINWEVLFSPKRYRKANVRSPRDIFETPCVQQSAEGRNLGCALVGQGRVAEWKRRRHGSKGTGRRNEFRTSGTKMELRPAPPPFVPYRPLLPPPSQQAPIQRGKPAGRRGNIDQDGDTPGRTKTDAANNMWHIFEISAAARGFYSTSDESFSSPPPPSLSHGYDDT